MMFRRGSGYSLIELLVVLAVIVMISLASLPNIFGRNDRLSLDTSANRIKQMLIDAKTRSLAPTGKEGGALGQVFQVSIGDFQTGQTNYTALGTTQTSTLTLERGSTRCDPSDDQGGFTQIRQLKLPRNIYISSFFPVRPSVNDTDAVVRFSVGKVGFVCGLSTDPSIDSTDFNDFSWIGKIAGASGEARARYLVITVSAQKLSEKRYVVVDRQTSEVTVSREDPQAFFTPLADTLKPKWLDVDSANFNLSLVCGTNSSRLVLTYPRAEDRVTDVNTTDPNLAVFYDISWNLNGEQANGQALFRPLAIRYFYDVRTGFETVRYEFETTAVSVSHQKFTAIVNVAASDQGGLLQDAYQVGAANAIERQRQKSFFLDCGNGTVKGDDEEDVKEQADPDVINEACLQNNYQSRSPMIKPGRYADLWTFNRWRHAIIIEGEAC
jgi:prepilin-type N-terminal cleavage/methylation domain-containing protein